MFAELDRYHSTVISYSLPLFKTLSDIQTKNQAL